MFVEDCCDRSTHNACYVNINEESHCKLHVVISIYKLGFKYRYDENRN